MSKIAEMVAQIEAAMADVETYKAEVDFFTEELDFSYAEWADDPDISLDMAQSELDSALNTQAELQAADEVSAAAQTALDALRNQIDEWESQLSDVYLDYAIEQLPRVIAELQAVVAAKQKAA